VVNRDFRKNPITPEEVTYCRWYAVVNDLIGGWSIATADLPESQINVFNDEFEVGTFMHEDTAKHIAYMHNCWWDSVVAASYMENLGSDFVTYCNYADLTRTY
jgi:hypothetical protein